MNSPRASFHAQKMGTIPLILPYVILSIEPLLGSPAPYLQHIITGYHQHSWSGLRTLLLVYRWVGCSWSFPFTSSAELEPASLCNALVAIWRICGEEISELESEVGCGRCIGLCNLKGRYAYIKYYIIMLLWFCIWSIPLHWEELRGCICASIPRIIPS